MWFLSKRSKEMAIEHAELELLIRQRTSELQILSQRLLKVQDEERRRFARDLHDTTGQTLAALKINASLLQAAYQPDPSAHALVSDVMALADQAIQEIRTMSYLLHPPLLDEVGFACAAEWYVEGFAKRSGIEVIAEFAQGERLSNRIELALFRILQESLTNVHRHSEAASVKVDFKRLPHAIVLEIRDFGKGITPERLGRLREASAEAGVGLAGMRERMNDLTGKLEMESNAGGTTVRATVPLTPLVQADHFSGFGSAVASSAALYQ
jgi:two-component system, NarL family, sensor kinase